MSVSPKISLSSVGIMQTKGFHSEGRFGWTNFFKKQNISVHYANVHYDSLKVNLVYSISKVI